MKTPRPWADAATALLGACYPVAAAQAGGWLFVTALLSGTAVAVSPWIGCRYHRSGVVLLLAGAVPFAVLTWWSLVVPLAGGLAVVSGITAMSPPGHRAPADPSDETAVESGPTTLLDHRQSVDH